MSRNNVSDGTLTSRIQKIICSESFVMGNDTDKLILKVLKT